MGPTENCENAKKKGKEKQRNPLKIQGKLKAPEFND